MNKDAGLMGEAAEMVISAIVQEGVSRTVSFVLGKRKERPSQGDMERLEMAVNEVESVVKRTAKIPIISRGMIKNRIMLKKAYMEGADLLSRHRKHHKAMALQNEDEAAAFPSLARRWVKRKVSSISSLFGWNKSSDDLSLSCDDIRRYQQFADSARNFLRDLESGYTLRHYTFCNPLVRYLLEGKTLTYQSVQWDIKRRLHISAMVLEDHGVIASLTYEYLDHGRVEKSFILGFKVQVSESTNIVAVGIRCLEAVEKQSSIVFLETAKGELAQLDNLQPNARTNVPVPGYLQELYAKVVESSYRPDPACCTTTNNHGYRTCPFPDPQVLHFRSVGFISRRGRTRGLLDQLGFKSDEASTSAVRHPPTPCSNNKDIFNFAFHPHHFDEGFTEGIVVEVVGTAQSKTFDIPQKVDHIELPNLTLDPFFKVKQEIISSKIDWVFQHGCVCFEWKTSKPHGNQCKLMDDSKAKGKALQQKQEEEEETSFPLMWWLATGHQKNRLREALRRLFLWYLKLRGCTARYKAEHFLSEPGIFHVGSDDLCSLIELHALGVGLIRCWTLYMIAKHKKEPVGFLDPQLVCEDTIRSDASKVEEYVTKAMLHHQDKIHILAPYNFSQSHWILIVIVLEHSTVLYLDSRSYGPEEYRLVTELIDRSFAKYISNKAGEDTPRQTTMEHRHLFPCHREPNKGTKSAYYVCHHMQEIIIQGAKTI